MERGRRERRSLREHSSSSMEIFSASASLTLTGFVPRLLPLLSPQARTTLCKPLLSSSSTRLISCHSRIAPSRSLADQSASTGISVVDSDPIDVVKRKAMDIAPELKGASIFLELITLLKRTRGSFWLRHYDITTLIVII